MKVAAVIDSRTMAINAGANHGVKVGNMLTVANAIKDPSTGYVIGHYPNLKVVVTEVFPKFCVVRTAVQKWPSHESIVVNIGDEVMGMGWEPGHD